MKNNAEPAKAEEKPVSNVQPTVAEPESASPVATEPEKITEQQEIISADTTTQPAVVAGRFRPMFRCRKHLQTAWTTKVGRYSHLLHNLNRKKQARLLLMPRKATVWYTCCLRKVRTKTFLFRTLFGLTLWNTATMGYRWKQNHSTI